MGNTSQCPIQPIYTFVQYYHDLNFGPTQIYQHNFHLNEFLTANQFRITHQLANTIKEKLEVFKNHSLTQINKFPFLKIIDWTINSHCQQNQSTSLMNTCRIPTLTVYMQFLRHTLKDFVGWRAALDRPFTLEEIILCAKDAITAFQFTKNNQFLGASLQLEDISVSVEGELKFNPLMGKTFVDRVRGKNLSEGLTQNSKHSVAKNIVKRRAFKSQKENNRPIPSKSNSLIEVNSSESNFLGELKVFCSRLAHFTGKKSISLSMNPEQSQHMNSREIVEVLNLINEAKTVLQVKNIVRMSQRERLIVDFERAKHQQNEERLYKILSDIQEKSQRTECTAQNSQQRHSIRQSIDKSPASTKAEFEHLELIYYS